MLSFGYDFVVFLIGNLVDFGCMCGDFCFDWIIMLGRLMWCINGCLFRNVSNEVCCIVFVLKSVFLWWCFVVVKDKCSKGGELDC